MELTLSFKKDSFTMGEKISCQLILTNTEENPFLVNGRMSSGSEMAPKPYREVFFKIVDPEGKTLRFLLMVNRGAADRGSFIWLGAGDFLGRCYDLSDQYFSQETMDDGSDRLVPGKYSIQAVYENAASPEDFDSRTEPSVWQGRLESNIVELELKPAKK